MLSPEIVRFIKGKKVMIVDDEAGIRELLATVFDACGAITTQASSGKMALAMLKELSADLIISDIRMPDGDGIALLSNVRSDQNQYPGFIFISGGSEFTEAMLLDKGAQASLGKPFSVQEVLKIAANVIHATSEDLLKLAA